MQQKHWAELGGGVELAAAKTRGLNMNSQHIYLALLREIYPFQSIVDMGCAAGDWLRAALDLGIKDIWGYDVTEMPAEHRRFPATHFTYADLGQIIPPPRKFDLAVSTEVAEHLPRSNAVNFVSNLTSFSDVVLFGAAIPYQGGVGHCNENWVEYWNVIFRERGFSCLDLFRPALWHRPDVHFYYRQNTLLFVKDSAFDVFAGKGLSPTRTPLSLVHPEMLIQAVNRSVPPQQKTFQRDAAYYTDLAEAKQVDQLPDPSHDYGQEDLWFENLANDGKAPYYRNK
jgi:hypothetical protein